MPVHHSTHSKRYVQIASVVFALLAFRESGASFNQYNTRSAWLTAVGGAVVTERFEDEPIATLSLPSTFAGSNFGIDVAVGTMVARLESGNQGYAFPVNGSKFLGTQNDTTRDYTAKFLLPYSTTAFGFDITGFQDFDNQGGIDIDLYLGNSPVDNGFLTLPGTYGPDFRGVVGTNPFDNVRLTFSNLDYVGFDDVSAAGVPEPAGAAALATGLALLLLRPRRRRIPSSAAVFLS
jgi:hypothetical protein